MNAIDRAQRLLPEYELMGELGRGGMGVVWLAKHLALGSCVAIKELIGDACHDMALRGRFRDEAKLLSALHHSHVVPLHDFVEHGDALFVIMPEMRGGTLTDLTQAGLTAQEAVGYAMAACAGVHHAHEHGIVHRDVKPDNLMLDEKKTLKVADFGIARALSGERTIATLAGTVLGTPEYMAPEQASGHVAEVTADVYALGVTLYEMLSGVLPFPYVEGVYAQLLQRTSAEPKPLAAAKGSVPIAIGDAVMTALERAPERRFATAEEFGASLGRAATDAWGNGWLSDCGVTVESTVRMQRAMFDPTVDVRPTVDLREAPEVARSDLATEAGVGEREDTGIEPSEIGLGDPPSAAPGATQERVAVAVKPGSPGLDMSDVDMADIIDLEDMLRRPRFPVVELGLAALGLALVAIVGLVGLGPNDAEFARDFGSELTVNGATTTGDDPLQIDLAESVVLGVPSSVRSTARSAEIGFSLFGLPLGSVARTVTTEAGLSTATLEPGPWRYVVAGGLSAFVAVLDDQGQRIGANEFKAEIANGWFTIIGLVGVVVLVMFFVYAIGNSRELRMGRRKIGRLVGFGAAGMLGGIFVVIVGSVWRLVEPTGPATVLTAALGAITMALIGLAIVQIGRRRRLSRVRAGSAA